MGKIKTLRDGALKATIWENTGENGPYHTVTLARVYEDRNGQLKDSTSFSGNELLRVSELAREAHGVVRDLRREQSLERRQQAQPDDTASELREQFPARERNAQLRQGRQAPQQDRGGPSQQR